MEACKSEWDGRFGMMGGTVWNDENEVYELNEWEFMVQLDSDARDISLPLN